jgi:iron complex outermembrane receptor protein
MQFVISGQAAFAQAAPEAGTADAIIVTARRTEERLQDVPISVAVVNQERLSKSNIVSAEDLARVVPGLNVQSRYSAEQSTFSIRGFSQELRTSSSVGTYFGEVVAPRGGGVSLQGGDGAGPGSLFDLQSVQVLKGPQGTLFGRNTTGGAVLLTPKKPTSRFEGYVEGSYGNYDMQRIQAVVNAPVTSWARLRIGIDRQTRDGFEHNVSGIGPRDFANVNYTAARGSLVLDVTPDIENYTIVSYLHSRNNGSIAQLFRANANIPGAAGTFGRAAVPQVNRLNASGDPYQVEQDMSNPLSLTKQLQIINTTAWHATDNLTVKNIASYSTFKQILRQDIFATNFGVPLSPPAFLSTSISFNADNLYTNNQRNFTEELQLQGNALDGKLNYQGGLYFEHSTPGGRSGSMSPSNGAPCQVGPFELLKDMRCLQGTVNFTTGTIEYINMASYAQATYAVTDKLKLTGGIRYTYDRSRGSATGQLARFSSTIPGAYGVATIVGCQTAYAASATCTVSERTSSKRPTWTLNASYNPTQDVMVYGTYSRGYRQGASSPFSAGGNVTFGPEKVDNFELGTKASFQGAVSGHFNMAGFYSNLTNQQLQIGLLNSQTGSTATSIFNAGKSRIYGVEFDGTLIFSRFFRIDGSGTYLNTKLKTINAPTTFPGYDVVQPSALAGDQLPFSPKWGTNVSGTVTLPTPAEVGKVEFTAAYRYNASYSTAASSTTSIRASAVSQLDLNLDWRNVAGKPIDLSFFASNVTNQFTQTLVTPLFNNFGFDTRYLGSPRMYGVRMKVRFSADK